MTSMRAVGEKFWGGFRICYPTHEMIMTRGRTLTCDQYPEIGERNCRVNGRLVGPYEYRRVRDGWKHKRRGKAVKKAAESQK